MLNRRTLLLLVIAIALGGGVLLFESSDHADRAQNAAETTGETQGKPLLPFEENAITQFTLTRPEQGDLTLVKDESGVWEMSAPEEQVAEDGAIAFLLSQLTRPSNRVINVDSRSLADFGLDNPAATVTLEATPPEAQKSTYELRLGDADFGGKQHYVQVINLSSESADVSTGNEESSDDKDSSRIEIHLVSGEIVDALKRPASEWISAEDEETDSTQL